MVEEWFLLRRARNEQAHISIIYIVVYTWIQMSNCIINRANTSVCFVAYSRARALYLVRLRCRCRCWCLKIRQEIICRYTHSHTHTHSHMCWLTGKVENLRAKHTKVDLLCWRRELMWKRALFLSTRKRFICLPSHNACCPSPAPPHFSQHCLMYVQFIKRHLRETFLIDFEQIPFNWCVAREHLINTIFTSDTLGLMRIRHVVWANCLHALLAFN